MEIEFDLLSLIIGFLIALVIVFTVLSLKAYEEECHCNSCTNKYDGTNGNGYQPCKSFLPNTEQNYDMPKIKDVRPKRPLQPSPKR